MTENLEPMPKSRVPAPVPAESDPKNFALQKQNASLTATDIKDVATLDEVIPGWRDKILELAAEGLGDQEIRVALCRDANGKFSPHTWTTLKNREVVIADYFEQAKAISEAWWTAKARDNLLHEKGTTFESTPWIFMMKNKFNWRDTKPESTQSTVVMGNVMQQVRQYITNQSESRAAAGLTDLKPLERSDGKKRAKRKSKETEKNS